LLPDPDFDVDTEVAAAAVGFGDDHSTEDGLSRRWGWADCSGVLDCKPGRFGGLKGFEAFVGDSRLWATSGSSSFGRLEYKTGATESSTKARKLMLPYCTTPAELIGLARVASVSRNVAVVKSELAKIRIAVAGDLGYYLLWSWIHSLTGDVYDQWPNVTLAESKGAELQRLYWMGVAATHCYGFPLDFQSFDKQVCTSESSMIGEALIACAEQRTLLGSTTVSNLRNGLLHATLATPKSTGPAKVFMVTDQLPSGIAITSAIGNAFNCVASESLVQLVEMWTGVVRVDWLEICALRGDDSSFQVTSLPYALLLALAGEVLHYRYAKGKIAIVPNVTELLRVQISEFGCRGYPSRLVPALTQRKPWSNEPWDAEGAIRAQWATCGALERRLVPGMSLWAKLSARWAAKRGLPRNAVSIPSSWGGLGLGDPPVRMYRVVPPLSTTADVTGVSVAVSSAWAGNTCSQEYAALGVRLNPSQVSVLVQNDALGSLSTVDLPEIARLAQSRYKYSLRNTVVVEGKPMYLDSSTVLGLSQVCELLRSYVTLDPWRDFSNMLPCTHFGSWAGYAPTLLKVLRLQEIDIDPGLHINPLFKVEADRLQRRFRCGTGAAMDWLVGIAPSASYSYVHPQLVGVLPPLVDALVERNSSLMVQLGWGFAGFFSKIAALLSEALLSNKFYTYHYSW